MDEEYELKRDQITGLYYQVLIEEPDVEEEPQTVIPPKKVTNDSNRPRRSG